MTSKKERVIYLEEMELHKYVKCYLYDIYHAIN